jgi:hypothetical protein
MLDIAFDVSVLVINKADIIYQAFNASPENEIQICIKKLVYQKTDGGKIHTVYGQITRRN